MMVRARAVVAVLFCCACASQAAGDPETCEGYAAAGAAACAEDHFWRTFQDDFDARPQALEILGTVIDAHPEKDVHRVYFLRGVLAVSMLTEQNEMPDRDRMLRDFSVAETHGTDRAYFYRSWRLIMDVFFAVIDPDADPEAVQALVDENIAHGEADLQNNLLALSNTWSVLPMSTGLPQKAVELLDRWVAAGRPAALQDHEDYPHFEAGLGVYIADSYLRVGRTEDARRFLEESIAAEDEDWSYRYVAEDMMENLEERAAAIAGLPEDSLSVGYMGVDGEHTCRLCHANR